MTVLIKMAFRNLFRNKKRTLITGTVVAFGIILAQVTYGFLLYMMDKMVKGIGESGYGHIRIITKSHAEDKTNLSLIKDSDTIVKEISKIVKKNGRVVQRIEISGTISSARNTLGVMIYGIEPEMEKAVLGLNKRMIKGSYRLDRMGTLIGKGLAKKLKVKPGSRVVLRFQTKDGTMTEALFKVRGIFSSPVPDFDSFSVFIDMNRIRRLIITGKDASVIYVNLTDGRLPEGYKDKIAKIISDKGVVVQTWKEFMPQLEQLFRLNNIYVLLTGGLVFFIIALVVINTMYMAVIERTREFGLLLSLGTTPGEIKRLVLFESFFLSLLSGLFGTLFGILLCGYFSIHGINYYSQKLDSFDLAGIGMDPVMYTKVDMTGMLILSLVICILVAISCYFPARRASVMSPTEAMRYI